MDSLDGDDTAPSSSAPEDGAENDDADPRIGKLVDDRYKIIAPMAAGSMGAVYKAERVPVGKLVALKFLHASFAKDNEFQIRFERETRVMSKLAHPNCVSVVDFGVWDDAPYLAMEYVAGTTLRALLDEGPLPVRRALVLARQIAAGLAHAHAQGVVHRDVKPANIMISDEVGTGDHVRILDFGLARLRSGGGRDATQTNVVVGTPNYMAPEQTIGGGTIDARTDIYAVGVVLFEMIAGERPFTAADTMALLGMHRAAPTPKLADRMSPLAPSTEIPDGVQELIEKAMAKDPDERFQTAVELAEALAAVSSAPVRARTEPPTAIDAKKEITAPVKTPASRGWLLALVGLAAAALAVWFVVLRDDDTPPPPPVAPAAIPAVPPVDATIEDAAVAVAPIDAEVDALELPEIEMDPLTADNPDPEAEKNTAEDEAPDAPETVDEEKEEKEPPPARARSTQEAIALIKEGKRELAISSLLALKRQQPNNANIPFLLGNLYFDKQWWSVALEQYAQAIKKASAYKRNAVLIKNSIKMLASTKTVRKAQAFLRGTIGAPAKSYLKAAAKSDKSSNVRKYSASTLRQIR